MNELALFSGVGGGILGGLLNGWRTICAVEIEEYPRRVLMQRQCDGFLAPFPIWDDITTFDGRPWHGLVDVVSGGFPCQDISCAGRGRGLAGARSGLWRHMARVIGDVRPLYVLVENSPRLAGRGLATVLGDLSEMGYDARHGVLSAADAIWLDGAPCLDHLRERIWIVAHADPSRLQPGRQIEWSERQRAGAGGQPPAEPSRLGRGSRRELEQALCAAADASLRGRSSRGLRERAPASDAVPSITDQPPADPMRDSPRQQSGRSGRPGRTSSPVAGCADQAPANPSGVYQQGIIARVIDAEKRPQSRDRSAGSRDHGLGWWQSEPLVGRVAHGVADRVERLKAIGNLQLPAVVALAWQTLTDAPDSPFAPASD